MVISTMGVGMRNESEAQRPLENDSVIHEAVGNLSFLLSVVRCGETLGEEEEANVRRVIGRLNELKARVDRLTELETVMRYALNYVHNIPPSLRDQLRKAL